MICFALFSRLVRQRNPSKLPYPLGRPLDRAILTPMKMCPPFVIVLLLLSMPVRAAESAENRERQQRIAEEVQRRRAVREEAARVAEVEARRLVREHESGQTTATEAQLAEARSLIRAADARLATKAPGRAAGGEELVRLKLPKADMATVASIWRMLFGGEVTVGERVKYRVVTMEFPATTRNEVRSKLVAGLRDHGIAVIERADGVLFDSEPAPKPER
jgi:hypothetical protein